MPGEPFLSIFGSPLDPFGAPFGVSWAFQSHIRSLVVVQRAPLNSLCRVRMPSRCHAGARTSKNEAQIINMTSQKKPQTSENDIDMEMHISKCKGMGCLGWELVHFNRTAIYHCLEANQDLDSLCNISERLAQ